MNEGQSIPKPNLKQRVDSHRQRTGRATEVDSIEASTGQTEGTALPSQDVQNPVKDLDPSHPDYDWLMKSHTEAGGEAGQNTATEEVDTPAHSSGEVEEFAPQSLVDVPDGELEGRDSDAVSAPEDPNRAERKAWTALSGIRPGERVVDAEEQRINRAIQDAEEKIGQLMEAGRTQEALRIQENLNRVKAQRAKPQ